jgi:uncharacterized protein
MEFEFDPIKDKSNRAKHGISLEDASKLDWDSALVRGDLRRDYGEYREIGYAPMGDRLYCVVFVRRGEVVRIISLRKANQAEVDSYEKS